MPGTNESISFIKRPEAKLGIAIPAVALCVIFYFFGSSIGDFVVNAADNMLHLGIVIGFMVFIGWLIFDSKFRMAASFCYLSLLRLFFSFDPLGNMKSIRSRFMERLAQFSKSLGELRGQRIKTQRSYDEAESLKNKELSMLAVAQKSAKPLAIQLASNNINRYQETMNDDAKQLKLYDILIERLSRGYELCTFKIEDMKQEIAHRERQMEDAKISRNIVKSAMGILKGNGMEDDVWESSNRQIESEYSAALGEVDNLLDLTKGIFDQADLLQEANVQTAMLQLDAWNAKNEGMMSGNRAQPAAKQLQAAPNSIGMINTGKPQYQPAPTSANTDGDDYLNLVK